MSDVSKIIYSQLGGNTFCVMTGAKDFVGNGNYLAMRVPRSKGKHGAVNSVKITLNGKDLYDVEYGRVHGMKYTIVYEDDDIYCDMLKQSFETNTGLYTSF